MFIAPKVEDFLRSRQASFGVLSRSLQDSLEQAANLLGIPHQQFVRVVLLVDHDAGHHTLPLMVALPLDHVLDFALLRQLSGRDLEIVAAMEAQSLFADCDAGCIPPFGQAYGLPQIIYDNSLFEQDALFFEAGRRNGVVQVSQAEFRKLARAAEQGVISRPAEALRCGTEPLRRAQTRHAAGRCGDFSQLIPVDEFKRRIESIYELPVLPDHVQRMLMLRNDASAGAAELARVMEQDPALAAQIVHYAQSPLFGYRGKVDSIQDAIARVLGYEVALNLALGLSTLRPFRIPADGALGMQALLKHATCSASLARQFAMRVAAAGRPNPGLLYLAGLLHNIGYLLFGHLFASEYFLLNRMVTANPHIPVTTLEKELLGMGQARNVLALGHGEVGAWLMEKWSLPMEVVTTLRQHHNEFYRGEHEVYVHIILLVDRLLQRYGIGDADSGEIPAALWGLTGLEEAACVELVEQMLGAMGEGPRARESA